MKSWIMSSLCILMVTTGCGQQYGDEAELNENEPEHELNYIANRNENANVNETEQRRDKFGYVRHTKNEANAEDLDPSAFDYIDRQQTAEGISKVIVNTQDVDEAAVLVTNQHALVAYQTKNGDKESVADYVKLATEAMVPYFYDVVITDNPALMDEIESLKTLEPQTASYDVVLKTISDMKDATTQPQTLKENEINPIN